MSRPQMNGVVFFHNDREPGSGVFSVSGSHAQPFQTLSSLPDGVIWLTNAKGSALPPDRKATFKNRHYLRPSFTELQNELDLGMKSPHQQAQVLSEVFDRVMALAQKRYDVQNFLGQTLAEDLAVQLDIQQNPFPTEVNDALTNAKQTWVLCDERPTPPGWKINNLLLPRMVHAHHLLSTPVPNSSWGDNLVTRGMPPEQMLRELLNKPDHVPVLLKATLHSPNHRIASLLPSENSGKPIKQWFTHNEYIALSPFVEFKIEGMYKNVDPYTQVMASKPFWDGGPFDAISLSAGILATSYCAALMEGRWPRSIHPQSGLELACPQAVWMSNTDRLLTLFAAMALVASGFHVKGYGHGKVRVECPIGRFRDLRTLSLQLGLDIPLGLQDQGPTPDDDHEDDEE